MKTAVTIVIVAMILYIGFAEYRSYHQSNKVEDMTLQQDLMNVRVNYLERITQAYSDSLREQFEDKSGLPKIRVVIP